MGEDMKNIIFIEGVSGVGKSTTVYELNERLQNLGYSVKYYVEGDPCSPLDLCWTAYLTIAEYERIITSYPMLADELSKNIILAKDYILLRYQIGRKGLYSKDLNDELRKREFCYSSTNAVPLDEFIKVFSEFETL